MHFRISTRFDSIASSRGEEGGLVGGISFMPNSSGEAFENESVKDFLLQRAPLRIIRVFIIVAP
jgi:hypothetical protein